ncbi:MAG TPA: hypothetical protein VLF88_00030 [Candidatus Babeliales bacterium]|nr:hypothetical protein [Candidatus Babeliales bacterium]
MIDQLAARYYQKKQIRLDPRYKPSDSIVTRTYLPGQSDSLVVIFPGWHTHKFPIDILAKRLNKRGWSVFWCELHDQILEPDDKTVVASFMHVRDEIVSELRRLTTGRLYRKIHFIGISLGTVTMTLVVEKFPHFTEASIVVGGDNLAVDMWHGIRTLYLRDEFKKQKISVKKLALDWKEEAPKNHVQRFERKRVNLIMSQTDKFILPKYQKALKHSLEVARADIIAKQRRTGHILTILRYCLIDKPVNT